MNGFRFALNRKQHLNNLVYEQLKKRELFDKREIFMCHWMKESPKGMTGPAIFSLFDNMLLIIESDLYGNVGDIVYLIDIEKIHDLSFCTNTVYGYMVFYYENEFYQAYGVEKHFIENMLPYISKNNVFEKGFIKKCKEIYTYNGTPFKEKLICFLLIFLSIAIKMLSNNR